MKLSRNRLIPRLLLLSTVILGLALFWSAKSFTPLNALLEISMAAMSGSLIHSIYDTILPRAWKVVSGKSRVRVSSPPGASLRALADFFCSPKTMERVVKPVISDMQKEFCKALAEKKRLKAAWIRIRGYWSFWKALGLHAVVKNLVEIWKISGMR
ncbi:MAG TPA: hypothetical protein VFQ43_00680 [Nitrososphaera sp.]|nr:hypothetical protein [Nitrososphaera sp.]